MKKYQSMPKGQRVDFSIRPYEVLFMLSFLLYLPVSVRTADDMYFITTFLTGCGGDLGAFLTFRYETWSTRLLLEAFTLLLLYFPILYHLSMPFWLTAIAAGIEKLAGGNQSRRIQWFLCMGIMLFPLGMQGRAGFVCTTVNYVFTLACLLWAIVPVVEGLRGKKSSLWQMLLSLLLMVIACNMEYYCPPILVLMLILTILSFRHKKNPLLPILLLMIVLGSSIFAANAPANTLAGYANLDNLFPGYELLGILDKLRLGLVSTAGGLISTYTHGDHFLIGTLTLCGLFVLRGIEKEHGLLRWIYMVPLAITLATGCAARLCPAGSLWKCLFLDENGGWLWNHPTTMVLGLLFFSTLLFCLWRASRGFCLWTAIALLCRITMGVSRSVFASGLRTFFPLLVALVAVCAMLCAESGKYQRARLTVLSLGMAASVIQNIVLLNIF